MSQIDPYLVQVSGRIVRMFQHYAQNINPEDVEFLTFISDRLERSNLKDPRAVPYSELCKHIKEGIREYLRQRESQMRPKK